MLYICVCVILESCGAQIPLNTHLFTSVHSLTWLLIPYITITTITVFPFLLSMCLSCSFCWLVAFNKGYILLVPFSHLHLILNKFVPVPILLSLQLESLIFFTDQMPSFMFSFKYILYRHQNFQQFTTCSHKSEEWKGTPSSSIKETHKYTLLLPCKWTFYV